MIEKKMKKMIMKWYSAHPHHRANVLRTLDCRHVQIFERGGVVRWCCEHGLPCPSAESFLRICNARSSRCDGACVSLVSLTPSLGYRKPGSTTHNVWLEVVPANVVEDVDVLVDDVDE